MHYNGDEGYRLHMFLLRAYIVHYTITIDRILNILNKDVILIYEKSINSIVYSLIQNKNVSLSI